MEVEKLIADATEFTPELILKAKQYGFSDVAIASLRMTTEMDIRQRRLQLGIRPHIKQIDTLAGEFSAETNYLYMTYHGCEDDIAPSEIPPVAVIGSGPYCIGSSVEFDWCAVNALKSLRKCGETTIMINSNPGTVSTDYQNSDRLYFEELTLERISDIADFENKLKGFIISVGGQIANNLAIPLSKCRYPILGTPVEWIDMAEDRQKFSSMLNDLGVDQPCWEEAKSVAQAIAFASRIGYPILVRPSYVLSGAAMNVIYNERDLDKYLQEAKLGSRGHPVVLSQFIENAKELEIDGVAKDGNIILQCISEHIENAGIHSGDATIVIPPQRIYLETIRQTKNLTKQIVKALNITGPFNLQFISKDNAVKVIECNVRASRSFPFVSKVVNHNFIDAAIKAILGLPTALSCETLELDWIGVKTSQFSFNRLKGSNPVAHVEMSSTGEVGCVGDTFHEAFMRSWISTGQRIQGNRLLLSITEDKRNKLLPSIKKLETEGWLLFATEGTHDFLAKNGIACQALYKASENLQPNISNLISAKRVDLIINIPTNPASTDVTDGYTIRRLAIDHSIPLITNFQIAKVLLSCLTECKLSKKSIKTLKEYVTYEE